MCAARVNSKGYWSTNLGYGLCRLWLLFVLLAY